ncbi:PREDICTED: uncharacterized protein LOC104816031 [Tarenaya hassleriana]|uniref:uncharacterized protein LOC104816031 n=1 Tax=Tarenaya hassleriana TaxID=28532 RepID=UPI00053C846E|nr:PREDICTED: uncharacterized protein LOC104816031 [Tarenaya hassleriana]
MVLNWAKDLALGAVSVVSSKLDFRLDEIIEFFAEDHKYAHLMKVDGLSTLSKHNAERCESSIFDEYGYQWKLVYFQRGKGSNKNVSLYVEMEDAESLPANRSILVDLHFFIISQSGLAWLPRDYNNAYFNSSNSMRGIANWKSFELLSMGKFLVNDSLVVGFEIKNMKRGSTRGVPRPVGTTECLRLIEKPRNNKFTWKITKFSTFKQTTHHSNPVVVGQREWVITMYPNGAMDGHGNSLSVYLKPIGYIQDAPMASTLGKITLRALNQLDDDEDLEYPFVHSFGPSSLGFGESQFLPFTSLYDESSGFLVNDVIYIGVEFHVISVTEDL